MNNSTLWAWISEKTYSALLIFIKKNERGRTKTALSPFIIIFIPALNNPSSNILTSRRYPVIFWEIDSWLDLWHFFEPSCVNADEIWHKDSLKLLRRLGLRVDSDNPGFFPTGPRVQPESDRVGCNDGSWRDPRSRDVDPLEFKPIFSGDWSVQKSAVYILCFICLLSWTSALELTFIECKSF